MKLTATFVKMGVPKTVAEKDACRIEHHISDASFKAVCNSFTDDNDTCILCADDHVKAYLQELGNNGFCVDRYSVKCALNEKDSGGGRNEFN